MDHAKEIGLYPKSTEKVLKDFKQRNNIIVFVL